VEDCATPVTPRGTYYSYPARGIVDALVLIDDEVLRLAPDPVGVLIAIVAAEAASISSFANSSGFDCSAPGFVDTGFTGHFVRSSSHTAWHRV
jgi:hypothetical protein